MITDHGPVSIEVVKRTIRDPMARAAFVFYAERGRMFRARRNRRERYRYGWTQAEADALAESQRTDR